MPALSEQIGLSQSAVPPPIDFSRNARLAGLYPSATLGGGALYDCLGWRRIGGRLAFLHSVARSSLTEVLDGIEWTRATTAS
jgi:hypothetical protein